MQTAVKVFAWVVLLLMAAAMGYSGYIAVRYYPGIGV